MEQIKTPFINIQTDFGFKFVFGQERNKKALIKFLNILFAGKLVVKDIVYRVQELLPSEDDGKRIIYDVYCSSSVTKGDSAFFPPHQNKGDENKERDHHFVLEMQNIYIAPFEERVVYYASKIIASQGQTGWKYELDPVFVIAITDFNISHMSPKLKHDIVLADRESSEILTDKVHIIMCSLKETPQRWEDCKTELEEVLFLIKNMENMDSTSVAYNDGKYAEIFNAARSNNLRECEYVEYSKSLERLRDIKDGLAYAEEKAREREREKALAEGMEKGLAEGMEKGLAEGRAEEKKEIARNMLKCGIAVEFIATTTGLSTDEIAKL